MNIKIGDKYKSKNGMIGTVVNYRGVLRLEVRNSLGRIQQTISLGDIDLKKFEKVEHDKTT